MSGFPKNARVCFLGDSITHTNDYIARIVDYYHTNLKDRNVNFYNCGVSGGNLKTLLTIFDEDIAVHKPTHAVIMIGINDSARYLLEEMPRGKERYNRLLSAFNVYKERLGTICEKLESMGTEIIMCTQTPYDEYQESDEASYNGGFALLAAYAEYVRNFAREKGYALCDYHSYISSVAQYENIINKDRVHPNELGHYHMAKCFLEFQGFDIGEYKPIPEYMKPWRDKIETLRNIHATEHLVIQDYSLTHEQRLEKAKAFIDNPIESPYKGYFQSLAKKYLEDKPKQKLIEKEIVELMEVELKK